MGRSTPGPMYSHNDTFYFFTIGRYRSLRRGPIRTHRELGFHSSHYQATLSRCLQQLPHSSHEWNEITICLRSPLAESPLCSSYRFASIDGIAQGGLFTYTSSQVLTSMARKMCPITEELRSVNTRYSVAMNNNTGNLNLGENTCHSLFATEPDNAPQADETTKA